MLNPLCPQEFIDILKKKQEQTYFLTFTRSSCPACIEMKHFLSGIEKKHPNIVFINLEVEKFYELADLNKVEAVPTSKLIVIKNNKIIKSSEKVIGFNKAKIEKLIQT